MGYIKEPVGIDFVVEPAPLSHNDRKQITEVISYFKKTGKVLTLSKVNIKPNFIQTLKTNI